MKQYTMDARGRTTVPADIRALIEAEPGTRLVWSVVSDGLITVRAQSKSRRALENLRKRKK
jgi:antitoxin PrlF